MSGAPGKAKAGPMARTTRPTAKSVAFPSPRSSRVSVLHPMPARRANSKYENPKRRRIKRIRSPREAALRSAGRIPPI